MSNEERLYEFERALDKIKWDTVGISEVRKQGEELIKRKNKNYFCLKRKRVQRGMIIHKDIFPKIMKVQGTSERIHAF